MTPQLPRDTSRCKGSDCADQQKKATEIIGSLYWCLYDLVTHAEGRIVPNEVHIAMAKGALSAARRFEDEAQATPQDGCND